MTGHGGAGGATTADGKPVPTPAKLQTMGLAYMHAWLAEDYWTTAQIVLALEDCGATMQQVAESFSLAAASVLTDAARAARRTPRCWPPRRRMPTPPGTPGPGVSDLVIR